MKITDPFSQFEPPSFVADVTILYILCIIWTRTELHYTRSSPRADLICAFSIGAQFQKVPEIFSSCGFLNWCAHHLRNKHEVNQESEGKRFGFLISHTTCSIHQLERKLG